MNLLRGFFVGFFGWGVFGFFLELNFSSVVKGPGQGDHGHSGGGTTARQWW